MKYVAVKTGTCSDQSGHCLHGRGFICNRIETIYAFRLHGAGRVRYLNRVVLNTLSKVEGFQNDTVSRSCKRRNRIDLKTVWSEVNMVNLARSAALCCTITTLICGSTSLLQLNFAYFTINREPYLRDTGTDMSWNVDFFVDTLQQSNEEKSRRRFWIRPGRT